MDKLDPENENHRKLVAHFSAYLPKPEETVEFAYMWLGRLFPGKVLKKVEEQDFVFTSSYTKELMPNITGDLQRLLMNLYWESVREPPKKEEGDETNEETLMKLFLPAPKE